MNSLLTVKDYEKAAELLLEKSVLGYYNSGAEDEKPLKRNATIFDRYLIRNRCLRDASRLNIESRFLSHTLSSPIAIAPSAMHRMAHPDGEISTIRAAKSSGTLMTLSSWTTTSLEDIAKEAVGHPIWYQFTVYRDRALNSSILRRAEAAGFSAVVVSVDFPVLGRRHIDTRNRFTLPDHLKIANLTEHASRVLPEADSARFVKYMAGQIDPSLTWNDLLELTRETHLPVIVKGIVRGDDARLAIQNGAKGIIVSNHGGRQMDSAPSTIEALSEVISAVAGSVPVWMDGGIRNGRDIFKAIALGAEGVFVGRPILWGLAVQGEDGVASILRILRTEFEHTMRLAGCSTLAELRGQKDLVVHESYYSKL